MRRLLFRIAQWLGNEGVVLAAFLVVLAIVGEPLWRPLLGAGR
jgi:hypothetical protein